MTNLFQHKKFTLHSGGVSHFKIECDAIIEEDYKTLAKIVSKKFNFKNVYGVPRGGIPFEKALKEYASDDNNNLLIVDDVLTTGGSMEEAKLKFHDQIFGIVVFARGDSPDWIQPVFKMQEFFK
jgi:orotate phosphoribosyltransferase